MTTKNEQYAVHWKVEPYNAVEMARWHYAFQQIFEELEAMNKKEGCVAIGNNVDTTNPH